MKWSTSRKKIFFVNSKEDCHCPCCGSKLKYRDQRLRVHKVAGGEKEWYLVRRLKCTNDKCRKLHNELPDCICPYNKYAAEHPFCELCFDHGIIVSTEEIHHKLSLSEGGTHDRSNLIALCKSCHSTIHAKRGDYWGNRQG